MLSENENNLPDTLTQKIGVLTRREVEARILIPVIEALSGSFGRNEVLSVVEQTIIRIAEEQGDALADTMGGDDATAFMDSLQYWTKDEALTIEVLENDGEKLHFNVTRCRYAEMYRALGVPELGALFSCNRDYALINGFNPAASLERTQTIMQGATHCDFRYDFGKADLSDGAIELDVVT